MGDGELGRVLVFPAPGDESTVARGLDERLPVTTIVADPGAGIADSGVDCVVVDCRDDATETRDRVERVRDVFAETPIVALVDETTQSAALAAGATDVCPIGATQWETLAVVVRNAISRGRLAGRIADIEAFGEVFADVNRAVLASEGREAVERAVCSRLVDVDAYAMAWVGRVEDEQLALSTVCRDRSPDATDSSDATDASADVMESPSATNASSLDALDDRLRQAIADRSMQSGEVTDDDPFLGRSFSADAARERVVVPLVYDESVVGVLAVYARATPDDVELRFLDDLGTNVARAVVAARTATELAENRRRMEAVVNVFPDLLFVYDRDGQYLEAITGAQVLNLERPDDLVGNYIHDFLPADAADRILKTVRDTIDTGEGGRIEYVVPFDGTEYWWEARTAVIPRPDEAEDHAVFIARDITERKRNESELERQNERLDEFASLVSHDLRNPLNVAQGNLELAQDDEHVSEAQVSLDRMTALIDDLLLLARTGKRVTETTRVSLPTVARMAWQSIAAEGSELVVDASRRTLEADEGRLRQLFENLYRNAVEHGGAPVVVRVEDLPDGFAIADDGVGFDAADVDRAFEHGYTTNAEGTGFGLGIVRDVAEAHGWTIDATESETGGARFEVRDVSFVDKPTG